ncbi:MULTISPECIES: hypothetical protein [unclassified Microcoleus]|uniref:hypothetical protein n=1 Tax=unclassified Microcoleus TaxID=2642155 RepID=UPI002FD5C7C3
MSNGSREGNKAIAAPYRDRTQHESITGKGKSQLKIASTRESPPECEDHADRFPVVADFLGARESVKPVQGAP